MYTFFWTPNIIAAAKRTVTWRGTMLSWWGTAAINELECHQAPATAVTSRAVQIHSRPMSPAGWEGCLQSQDSAQSSLSAEGSSPGGHVINTTAHTGQQDYRAVSGTPTAGPHRSQPSRGCHRAGRHSDSTPTLGCLSWIFTSKI